jgi:hypothetical protein
LHAYSYILRYVESDIVDRSAYQGQDNTIFLPYRKINFFYGEYEWYCKHNNIEMRARESTFRRAFKKVKEEKSKVNRKVKLSGGKGSFEQCKICHNAEQLLLRRHWSQDQKEVILTYRRRHIAQQFAERVTLENNIAKTNELDANGQPLTCLAFSDGFSVWKGNTPKKGDRAAKGDSNHITSRIIGVEVHCGPIHGTMLYYTDNLTGGGANAIIDVMRQSLLDLQILLEKKTDYNGHPLDLPDHLILQFDNCAENKNKYVFAYISMLVEERHFKVVEVFFLIVGHTHASIDQYFSRLAKKIYGASFIGSPLALEALLAKQVLDYTLSGPTANVAPLLVRKITVVYDVKRAIASHINPKLKYYSIPQVFRFELFHSVCVMQYAIFSTHKQMLPLRPEIVPNPLNTFASVDVALDFLSFVGGEKSFLEACGVKPTQSFFSLRDKKSTEVRGCATIYMRVYISCITNLLLLYRRILPRSHPWRTI